MYFCIFVVQMIKPLKIGFSWQSPHKVLGLSSHEKLNNLSSQMLSFAICVARALRRIGRVDAGDAGPPHRDSGDEFVETFESFFLALANEFFTIRKEHQTGRLEADVCLLPWYSAKSKPQTIWVWILDELRLFFIGQNFHLNSCVSSGMPIHQRPRGRESGRSKE